MNNILQDVNAALSWYWHTAIDPLSELTWQTASLFLIILLSLALIATWLLSTSWVWPWTKGLVQAGSIKPGPHTYKDHLRISRADYLRFHQLRENTNASDLALARQRARDLERYYVVTIVERDKRKVVVYREMKLQCPMGGKYQTSPNEVQLDEAMLTQVRMENGNVEDDEPGTPIAGKYDVYVRSVRWYDIRHWLLHPNREIRIVIWVTIITTSLPLLKDVLFSN